MNENKIINKNTLQVHMFLKMNPSKYKVFPGVFIYQTNVLRHPFSEGHFHNTVENLGAIN